MRTRRFFFASCAATFLALMGTLTQAQSAPTAQIGGSYNAYGMGPDGQSYTGTVQISQNGSAARVVWWVEGQTYQGNGVIDGHVFIVDWGAATPVIYVIVGSELHGTWNNGTALEKLVPN